MASEPPLASPLKQVNTQGKAPPSKLDHSWLQLSTNPLLFSSTRNPTPPVPSRWFADFFCLKPSLPAQDAALDRLSVSDLVGPYQHNVSLLFSSAVNVLKSAPSTDVTRSNAVETLIPLCRNVLGREYPDQSEDVLSVLAGSVERRDQVFTDFVSAIDLTLQDSQVPVSVRHRTLQLALVTVASVNQGALVAFFLRRDLFSTLVAFIADRDTQHFTFEATLFLGLLAGYRKDEARNPYGVRIEDFVEEGAMERILDVTSTVCLRARDAYVALADDTPASFAASLSSLVWSTLRIGGELLSGGIALPGPPPPLSLHGAGRSKGKEKAVEVDGGEDGEGEGEKEEGVPSTSSKGSEVPRSPNGDAPAPLADGPSPPAAPLLNGPGGSSSSSPSTPPPSSPPPAAAPPNPAARAPTHLRPLPPPRRRTDDSPFAALPPEALVLLVPFSELLTSNKTFSALVFAPRPVATAAARGSSSDGGAPAPPAPAPAPAPPLSETLISLTSYLASHASASPRARLYARLALECCAVLVEEGEAGRLSARSASARVGGVRICRQRHPMLPQRDDARAVPLSALVDTVVCFLRHNLTKRLDVETYAIALRLLQRVFQQLKAEHVRLARDWVVVWRAMLSLASFLVSHSVELRSFNADKLDALISQLFITLAYATYWAAQLLPSPTAQAELFYEILHADHTLSALSDLLGISSVAPAPPRLSMSAGGTTPTGGSFPAKSAAAPGSRTSGGGLLASQGTSPPRPGLSPSPSPSASSRPGTGAGFVATECISNLRSIVTFFSAPIAELRAEKRRKAAARGGDDDDHVEPDELLRVIRDNLGGVELIESAAMGDLPPRSEAGAGVGAGARERRGRGEGAYWRRLGDVACADTLRLMRSEGGASS